MYVLGKQPGPWLREKHLPSKHLSTGRKTKYSLVLLLGVFQASPIRCSPTDLCGPFCQAKSEGPCSGSIHSTFVDVCCHYSISLAAPDSISLRSTLHDVCIAPVLHISQLFGFISELFAHE